MADLRQYVVVADRFRASGGWTVDVIHLSSTPDHRDGEWLRVSLHGSHVEGSGIAVDGRDPHVRTGGLGTHSTRAASDPCPGGASVGEEARQPGRWAAGTGWRCFSGSGALCWGSPVLCRA